MNVMKLEINYKNKIGKTYKHVRLNKMFLNNQWVNEEIKEKNLRIHKQNQ